VKLVLAREARNVFARTLKDIKCVCVCVCVCHLGLVLDLLGAIGIAKGTDSFLEIDIGR